MRTARTAQSLISRAFSLPRALPLALSGASTAALVAERRSRWWSPPNANTVKSVPVGMAAGAVSFSLSFVTVAEAKERPPVDLLPKEVVLYQYQACPFCNKVRGMDFCRSLWKY
jgi:microsomal prostaglandin-E synthase 2